jgi:hypothetical protein
MKKTLGRMFRPQWNSYFLYKYVNNEKYVLKNKQYMNNTI